MNIGNVLQIRTKTEYQSQICRNVFHYRVISFETLVDETWIAENFRLWYENEINPMLVQGCNMVETQVHNLSDGIGLGIDTVSVGGDVAGSPSPSFVCWAFRFNRETLVTRHGQKRFAGVDEGATTGNAPSGSILTTAPDAAAAMAADFEVTGTVDLDFVLRPIIVGRSLVGGQYVLDLERLNGITSVDFTGISSQVSRKSGRGE